jgi:transcriptional repressor NrdR
MLVLQVAKRDARREQFDRKKLMKSLQKACAKRPLPTGRVEKIVEEIDLELQKLGRAEIPSSLIGEMAIERLKDLDRVAYIRYASVYRDFRDIETFKEEVEALLIPEEKNVTNNQLPLIPTDELFPSRKKRRGRPRISGIQTD